MDVRSGVDISHLKADWPVWIEATSVSVVEQSWHVVVYAGFVIGIALRILNQQTITERSDCHATFVHTRSGQTEFVRRDQWVSKGYGAIAARVVAVADKQLIARNMDSASRHLIGG